MLPTCPEKAGVSDRKCWGEAVTLISRLQLKLMEEIYKREVEIFRKLIGISEESMKGF